MSAYPYQNLKAGSSGKSRCLNGDYDLVSEIGSRLLKMAGQQESQQEHLVPGFWRHGRYYGEPWSQESEAQPGAEYLFPVDMEEKNRLDVFHHFNMLLRGRLFKYDIPSSRQAPRILDLGTGTGIWAINVCQNFENAYVLGVDLHFIQPQFIPRNYKTQQFNIEAPLYRWQAQLTEDWDLVYLRHMLGSITTAKWWQTYQNIFSILRPGSGRIEQVELDWRPHWEDSELVPNPSRQDEWSERLLTAMDQCGKTMRVDGNRAKYLMQQAGFTDFEEEVLKCYVNPSTGHPDNDKIAQWFNLSFTNALPGVSLRPMIEYLGMTEDQVYALCRETKEETCRLRFRAYYRIHIWTARKPE